MQVTRSVLHNGVKKFATADVTIHSSCGPGPLTARVYSANTLWRPDLRPEKYVFRLQADNNATTRCGLDLRR